MSSNRNTIYVKSEKIKNCTGDYERHALVNLHNWRHLKSIAFTKFDIAHTLLAVKIRMTACSKEKRTWIKTSPKLCYKLQYFRNY